jgi:hypothetical protein
MAIRVCLCGRIPLCLQGFLEGIPVSCVVEGTGANFAVRVKELAFLLTISSGFRQRKKVNPVTLHSGAEMTHSTSDMRDHSRRLEVLRDHAS